MASHGTTTTLPMAFAPPFVLPSTPSTSRKSHINSHSPSSLSSSRPVFIPSHSSPYRTHSTIISCAPLNPSSSTPNKKNPLDDVSPTPLSISDVADAFESDDDDDDASGNPTKPPLSVSSPTPPGADAEADEVPPVSEKKKDDSTITSQPVVLSADAIRATDENNLLDEDFETIPSPSTDEQLSTKNQSETETEPEKEPVVSSTDKPVESAEEDSLNSLKVELTPEQIEKAKAAREAAESAAAQASEAAAKRNTTIRMNASKVFTALGERTRTFELGKNARAKAEVYVARVISEAENKEVEAGVRIQGKAAKVAKQGVDKVTGLWEKKAVPAIQTQLPKEFEDVQAKTLASITLGLFVAFVLAPSLLFGGVGKKVEQVKKVAQLDKDTTSLQKKLAKVDSSISSRNSAPTSKSAFPPENDTVVNPRVAQPRKTITTPSSTTSTPPPSTKPDSLLSSTTTAKTSDPNVILKQTTTASSVKEKEPIMLKDVTPEMALSSVTKKLSTKGSLILSASFDSLYEEPTVALTVSKGFLKLSNTERRLVAEKSLQGVRSLGYERVTLTVEGSDRQLAQAGIDIDLEDETENLRTEIKAMRNQSDTLAIKNSKAEATIDGLNERLEEERDEIGKLRLEYNRNTATLRKENSDLAEDLIEAKDEISKIPDLLELEKRTIEAETVADKMSNSVEMLSIQLSKARGDESASKEAVVQANVKVETAAREKGQAIGEAEQREKTGVEEAKKLADEKIMTMQKQVEVLTNEADMKVKKSEEQLQIGIKNAENKTEEVKTSYEKKVVEIQGEKEKEVTSVSKKYEAMLDELNKKVQADIELQKEVQITTEKKLTQEIADKEKEISAVEKKYGKLLEEEKKNGMAAIDAEKKAADSMAAQLTKDAKAAKLAVEKERDLVLKEKAKVEATARKDAEKTEKEKTSLQKQIEKLQAKVKGDELAAAQETPAEVKSVPVVAPAK